jgi:hypothetical protein
MGDRLRRRLRPPEHRAQAVERVARLLHGALEQQLGLARPRRGLPAVTRRGLLSVGGHVEQQRRDVDAGDPVGERVVDLRDDRPAPAAQLVDEVRLPERAVAVQRLAEELPGERPQLCVAARLRQPGVAHVEVDLEARVVDPAGPQQRAGGPREALAVARQALEPRLDGGGELVVGRGVALEHEDPSDMHVGRAVLDLQERSVECTQSISRHVVALLSR